MYIYNFILAFAFWCCVKMLSSLLPSGETNKLISEVGANKMVCNAMQCHVAMATSCCSAGDVVGCVGVF